MTNPASLIAAIAASWSEHTGYGQPGRWDPTRPARGQCVTSSLVVQDYLGGRLGMCKLFNIDHWETHTFNIVPPEVILDVTAGQYDEPITRYPHQPLLREHHNTRAWRLNDEETRLKYQILRTRVAERIGEPYRPTT